MDLVTDILGRSPALLDVKDKVTRLLAGLSAGRRMPPIFIRGETGTGKGLVARLIHRASPRADAPFVDVNCAAIPETLLEAEMFGYERGAFTDARHAKPGLFQTAHRGTIFLDEIGLLPEALQGKLLKVIEEHSVRRLGSTRSEPVDVWIIAATSASSESASLRPDLYHRLSVLTFSLPPLRERDDDIALLAEHFLARACHDYGLPPRHLTPDALTALRRYPWPGNVRELANVMERVALLTHDTAVTAERLGLFAPTAPGAAPSEGAPVEDRRAGPVAGDEQRETLHTALRAAGGNISRAARRLGLTRNTLRYRIRKFALGAERPPAMTEAVAPATTPAATSSASTVSSSPAVDRAGGGVRWSRRLLAFVRVVLSGVEDPSGIRPELSRSLDLAVEKVESFGGHVDEIGANRLEAIFGHDGWEDAPTRAALALMAVQKSLAHDPANPIRLSGTVHAGHFLVARLGGQLRVDVGEKRETAAVLDGLGRAAPQAIVASGPAATLIERRFELTPLAVADGGIAYRLDAATRPGFRVGGRVTRFVAREQERELLRSRLAAARRASGHVVAIVGDAGIGKSRLVFEFLQEARAHAVMCVEGRCLSYASGTAYLPVLDLLRGVSGITEADSPATITLKVRAVLTSLGIDAAEALPLLLNVLSLPEGRAAVAGLVPAVTKVRTFEAVREILVRTARVQPSIVVVEDLHWIDGISEEFLASLIEVVPAIPLLVIVTYRPGHQLRWINRSFVSQIALQPLSSHESLEVVRAVVREETVPEPLAQLVLAKAEGNPFYIEELTRAVTADGQLEAEVIPDTIQGLLLSRIDRLTPADKRVLQTAAAIGRYFSSGLLATVAGLPTPELAPILAGLQDSEFVYATTLGPEPRYAFKHALTHDVAYASLEPDERRSLHVGIVDALERAHADRLEEHIEALAHHAFLAEAWQKGVRYLKRAGERACDRSANQEALMLTEQAITCCRRLGEAREFQEAAIDLRLLQQMALFELGQHGRIRQLMLEAKALAETLEDRSRQARVAVALVTNYYVGGEHDEGLRVARRALDLAVTLPDRGPEIGLLIRLGHLLHARAELTEAIAALRRAVDLLAAEPASDHQVSRAIPSVQARTWLSWCLADVGAHEDAVACALEAWGTAERRHHPYSQVMAAWAHGYCLLASGRVLEAVAVLEQGLDLCRTWNNIHWTARTAGTLGYASVLAGRADEGLRLLERGISEGDRIGLRACSPLLLIWLGETHRRAGRDEDARRVAAQAVDRAVRQGERAYEAGALILRAAIEQKEADYRDAISRAVALRIRPLLDPDQLGLSRLLGSRRQE